MNSGAYIIDTFTIDVLLYYSLYVDLVLKNITLFLSDCSYFMS